MATLLVFVKKYKVDSSRAGLNNEITMIGTVLL
jgi:hypothetical protein